MIGYLRSTDDFAVVLEKPIAGHGRCKSTDEKVWMRLEFEQSSSTFHVMRDPLAEWSDGLRK